MNKSKIAVAVFAVIAAASVARAEVDFDGTTGKAAASSLKTLVLEYGQEYTMPLPQVPHIAPAPDMLPPCGDLTTVTGAMPCDYPDCQQQHNNTWWWIAECGYETPSFPPVYIDAPAGAERRAAAAKSSTKNPLADLIISYANAYPEFVASVMPIFKDKKASVVYDRNGAYIMSGRKVARLDFAKLSKMAPATQSSGQTKILPALEAAAYAVQAAATWYGAYQAWSEYHSSDTTPGNTGGHQSVNPELEHQTQWEIDHNIQRSGAAH